MAPAKKVAPKTNKAPKNQAPVVKAERDKQKDVDLLCEVICISEKGLKRICEEIQLEDPGFPSVYSFLRMFANNPEWAQQYAHAKETQADVLADQIIDICDDTSNDYIENEDGSTRLNAENIQRSRLRVDARKWIASKLKPKKYGDKLEQTISGEVTYKKIEIQLVKP
jgi:hypothetical protein